MTRLQFVDNLEMEKGNVVFLMGVKGLGFGVLLLGVKGSPQTRHSRHCCHHSRRSDVSWDVIRILARVTHFFNIIL